MSAERDLLRAKASTPMAVIDAAARDFIAEMKAPDGDWSGIALFVYAERILINLLRDMPADQRAAYAADVFAAFKREGIEP